jgi:hypothetical protein
VVADDELWSAFIGKTGGSYYRKIFSELVKDPSTTTPFNGMAGFLGWMWFLYRKMYLQAAVWLILLLVLLPLWAIVVNVIPLGAVSGGGRAMGKAIAHMVLFLVIVGVPGLFANRWYFNFAKRRIESMRRDFPDRQALLQELSRRGGTNVFAVGAVVALFVTGIAAAIFIPTIGSSVDTTASQLLEQRPSAKPWLSEQEFFAELDRAIPWWEPQNTDAGFLVWLADVDPATGQTRQARLNRAFENRDVDTAVQLFSAYRSAQR